MRRKISRDRSLSCASPACGVPIWDGPTGTSLDNDRTPYRTVKIVAPLREVQGASHQHQSASVLNTISTFTRRGYFIHHYGRTLLVGHQPGPDRTVEAEIFS